MHDLIQEMGHYIVRGDHLKNPEKFSRIWEEKDVQSIWAMDASKELDNIEVISVKSYMYDSLPSQNHQVVANMTKLRWIDWTVGHASSLPRNFPPGELRCLILRGGHQRQLWKGYKFLPNLRMIKLQAMDNLITTPDFRGLPNLERFMLLDTWNIKEIHPSIEGLEKLVCLSVEYCDSFKRFPPISVIKKLETLIISKCIRLSNNWKKVTFFEQYCTNFSVRCLPCCGDAYEDEPSRHVEEPLLFHKGINHAGLQLISRCLRKLILRQCNFGDEDIDYDVWDLPNLLELDLSINLFSRLNFSILKLPGLKWLDVSRCKNLVELSGLPSSISSLRADWCESLKSVGDTSNCKWLWNVSFYGRNNGVSTRDGDIVLQSLLEGNAIEDHFISFTHSAGHHIPKRFADRLVSGKTFTLQLPPNWYNEYSGFLIFNANNYYALSFTISMKQDPVKDSRSEVCQDSDEAPDEPHFYTTYVGYVSFNSLMRHGVRLNSAYNMISFSIDATYETSYEGESRFVAELISRKRKDDHAAQTMKVTTDCSHFYDEEREFGKTFTIQRHSESSIKILWCPCYWY